MVAVITPKWLSHIGELGVDRADDNAEQRRLPDAWTSRDQNQAGRRRCRVEHFGNGLELTTPAAEGASLSQINTGWAATAGRAGREVPPVKGLVHLIKKRPGHLVELTARHPQRFR